MQTEASVFSKKLGLKLVIWTYYNRTVLTNFGMSFVEIMAYRLIGAKQLSEPMLEYCDLSLRNKL